MNHEPNEHLDDQLRQVEIPSDMLNRLRDVASFSDSQLDFELRDVRVPSDLLANCKAAIADEKIDEQIRDVMVSRPAIARARIIPQQRTRSFVKAFALAATLLIAVGVPYYASVTGILATLRVTQFEKPSVLWVDVGPLDISVEITSRVVPMEVALAEAEPTLDNPFAEEPREIDLANILAQKSFGPAGAMFRDLQNSFDPTEDVFLMCWDALGYPASESESTPDLDMVPASTPIAGSLPWTPGFDRGFLFRSGLNPVVFPAAGQESRESIVPLETRDDAYQRLVQSLAAGRLPSQADVRIEQIQAAFDYDLPSAPQGKVAIRRFVGPSPFNSQAGLLHVAAQAGDMPNTSSRPISLTLLVDVSSDMTTSLLKKLVENVQQSFGDLRSQDRISLILFSDRVVHSMPSMNVQDAQDALESLNEIRPAGVSNVNAALRHAMTLLKSDEQATGTSVARFVLVQPRLVAVNYNAAAENDSATLAAELKNLNTTFDWVRVAEFDTGGADQSPTAVSSTAGLLAEQTGGQLVTAVGNQGMQRSLAHAIRGRSTILAEDVQMRVAFNPQAVAAYRLIGNEPQSTSGLFDHEVKSNLHAGESASQMYEVWLKPNANNNLATVTVEWSDPASGSSVRTSAKVSRVQVATSWPESAPALQFAALVSEAAELLRASSGFRVTRSNEFTAVRKQHDLQDVLDRTYDVHATVQELPDFQRFQSLLEQIIWVKQNRFRGKAS